MSDHIIVYSHGFGVRKDDRGLFSDIAAALPAYRHMLFNYNAIDETANTLTVPPLAKQVEMLTNRLETLIKNKAKMVDLICHSQGCVVAALAQPRHVRKVIFLAPPSALSLSRIIRYFGGKAGSTLQLDGRSLLSRSDGSTTIVPADYWHSLEGLNLLDLYRRLAGHTDLVMYQAGRDEILGRTRFEGFRSLIVSDADHNFIGSRPEIIKLLASELARL